MSSTRQDSNYSGKSYCESPTLFQQDPYSYYKKKIVFVTRLKAPYIYADDYSPEFLKMFEKVV